MEEFQDSQVKETKKVKVLKEIQEIAKEKEKIYKLLETNDEKELQRYLNGELTQKHYIEKAIHNLASNTFPKTVEENANNALLFLNDLERKKEMELLKDEEQREDF